MKLFIVGDGVLAKAARDCNEHHDLVKGFNPAPDVTWLCRDVVTAPTGEPDQHGILHNIIHDLRQAPKKSLILISSPLRVGTTKALEGLRPDLFFAYSPENIRVKTAMTDFANQKRIVVGRRSDAHDKVLTELLSAFTDTLIWTDPETAEAAKHFLNGLLALQVAFANEMATLCGKVGADPQIVSRALLSDGRVSPDAPLKPGGPYAPNHLGREVFNLELLASQHGLTLPLIQHISDSNNRP